MKIGDVVIIKHVVWSDDFKYIGAAGILVKLPSKTTLGQVLIDGMHISFCRNEVELAPALLQELF